MPIRNINLTRHKKVHNGYGSWASWRNKSSVHSSVLGLKVQDFSPRVAVTIISRGFDKLGIIVYYRIWSKIWTKDDSSKLSLLFTRLLKRAWKNKALKSKIFHNRIWNSLSARTTVVNETLLVQTQSYISRNFPRLEIKFIFNRKSYLITISRDVLATVIIQCPI